MAFTLSVLCLVLNIYFYKKESIKNIYFTPLFCIAIPYSIIMLFVSIYDLIDFNKAYKMSYMVPLVSILIFSLFIIVGILLKFNFEKKYPYLKEKEIICKKNDKDIIRKRKSIFHGVIYDLEKEKILISLVYISFVIIAIIYFIKYGFHIISTVDFKNFFSSGIQGHLVNVITALLLIIFSFKKFYYTKIVCLFWIIFLALGNAKYLMLMYAMTLLIIFAVQYYKSFSMKKMFILLIVIASFFIMTYFLRFIIAGTSILDINYKFLFDHFYYYLVGSFYSFSKVLTEYFPPTDNIGYGIVFAPIINVFRLLCGNRNFISPISRFISVEINSNYTETNVYTLFGAIYFETNIYFMLICVIAIAIIAYFLYYNFLIRKKQSLLIIFSFFLSTLFYSFFNCFYGVSNLIEIIVLLLIITQVCKGGIPYAKERDLLCF